MRTFQSIAPGTLETGRIWNMTISVAVVSATIARRFGRSTKRTYITTKRAMARYFMYVGLDKNSLIKSPYKNTFTRIKDGGRQVKTGSIKDIYDNMVSYGRNDQDSTHSNTLV